MTARGFGAPAPSIEPPRTENELMRRARALGGRTLHEIARTLAGALPPGDPSRHKGAVGTLIERALGAPKATRSEPDFAALGIELKTLPIDAQGRPAESTFVTSTPRSPDPDWAGSCVRRKLARVLFVPVTSEGPFAERVVGSAFLWSPSASEEQVLRTDWEELTTMLASAPEGISARHGVALQLRPKAASSAVRVRASDLDGSPLLALPRAFYLRRTFTIEVLRGAGFLR